MLETEHEENKEKEREEQQKMNKMKQERENRKTEEILFGKSGWFSLVFKHVDSKEITECMRVFFNYLSQI